MRGTIAALVTALAVSGVSMQAQGRQITVPGGGTLPFSLGVKADGLIYVAGTLAQEGDIKAQTKTVLDSIGQTLTKSGSSLANVVAVHVYVKNAADAAGMTEVWRTVWPKDAPVRTTIVVAARRAERAGRDVGRRRAERRRARRRQPRRLVHRQPVQLRHPHRQHALHVRASSRATPRTTSRSKATWPRRPRP